MSDCVCAHASNPAILGYGLPWGFPSWIGNNGDIFGPGHLLTPDQAKLVSLCHAGIVTREGAERAGEIARRWALAQNTAVLLNQVREDLCVQHAEPFHPGSERLRPLATRAELTDGAEGEGLLCDAD